MKPEQTQRQKLLKRIEETAKELERRRMVSLTRAGVASPTSYSRHYDAGAVDAYFEAAALVRELLHPRRRK